MTKFFPQLGETLKTLKLLKLCVSPLWRPFLSGCACLFEPTLGQRNPVASFSKANEGRTRRASSRRIEGSPSVRIPPWKESMDDPSKNVDRLMIRHDENDGVFELENRSIEFIFTFLIKKINKIFNHEFCMEIILEYL